MGLVHREKEISETRKTVRQGYLKLTVYHYKIQSSGPETLPKMGPRRETVS